MKLLIGFLSLFVFIFVTSCNNKARDTNVTTIKVHDTKVINGDIMYHIKKIDLKKELGENGLKLIIYYNSLMKLYMVPLTHDSIRRGSYDYKIIVDSDTLMDRLDELEKLNDIKLIIDYDNESFVSGCRSGNILCDFRNKNDELIFSYSFGGIGFMFVNEETPVKTNEFLVKFITKYLPDDAAIEYSKLIEKWEFIDR